LEAVQTFKHFLQYEKKYSILTVQAYTKDLEQFFAFTQLQFTIVKPQLIQHLHIRSWVAELNSNNNNAKTINRKISTLKSFFKYCLSHDFITELPTTKLVSPKIKKKLPVFLQEKQIQDLLDNIVELDNNFVFKTERLIIELLYSTGMRRAELYNLTTNQIEFGNQIIRVVGKGNKERLLPVFTNVLQLIQDYIDAKKEIEHADFQYLLILPNGKRVYEKYIYAVVKKHLGTVSTQQHLSPHSIRHSFATHILNNGGQLNAIKELLGHTSLAATQVYTHTSIDQLKKVFEKAHPKA
jgi:integrase/recombinase XerC